MDTGRGSLYRVGYAHGTSARPSVRYNVHAFFAHLSAAGYRTDTVLGLARDNSDLIADRQEHIAGIAEGAQLPYEQLLAYNLYRDLVSPDECTVFFAIGKASGTGSTVFAKNSDKVGGESLVGPNFYKFKEINVLVYDELKDGLRVCGVAAAGSTSVKMGMNNRGIVGGANISRTVELDEKSASLTKMRALDRGYLLRIGLEQSSVLEAVKLVSGKITENPMGTPGNLEFADARQGYVIEGSYDRLAVKKIVDEVDSRSNRFITLEYLDRKDDLSSYCRYYRTQELLQAKKGQLTMQDMIQISMDHANGPGPNSICRHGSDCHEEVSLSAMVMEINGQDPTKSKWAVCVGKPCHAWRAEDGHVFGDMQSTHADFPEPLYNGEMFKKYYQEDALNA